MRALAIAQEQPIVYEGDGAYGYALWPAPVIAVATVITTTDDETRIPSTTNLFATPLLFREDSFDPITRIRRGRLYKRAGAVPQQWQVAPHPILKDQTLSAQTYTGWVPKELHTFHAWAAWAEVPKGTRPLLALGTLEAFTLWRMVDVERVVTGEDLLTLRARGALGILPELHEERVPEDARSKAVETLEKLSDAAYRAGPEAVIDRARDAAQWLLGTWLAAELGDVKCRQQDLAALAKTIPDEKGVLKLIAQALARLHSRGKPNEQERYQTRPLTEGDAEFALAATGALLRELGWAR